MRKNCLTCKYEPDWSEWSQGEYPRQSGACKRDKWAKELIAKLPETYQVTVKHITRFSDDSGVMNRCPAWESKDNEKIGIEWSDYLEDHDEERK